MKRVISLQTEDGKLFTDKCKAYTHEAFLQLRGLMNQGRLGRDATVGDAAIAMRRANCKTVVDSEE